MGFSCRFFGSRLREIARLMGGRDLSKYQNKHLLLLAQSSFVLISDPPRVLSCKTIDAGIIAISTCHRWWNACGRLRQ